MSAGIILLKTYFSELEDLDRDINLNIEHVYDLILLYNNLNLWIKMASELLNREDINNTIEYKNELESQITRALQLKRAIEEAIKELTKVITQ